MRWIQFLVSVGFLMASCMSIRAAGAGRHADPECARPPRLTDGWQVASPEAVGIDAAVLCGVVEFGPHTTHDLRSVSKSVTSLLFGIALAQGKIRAVDDPVLITFPSIRTFVRPSESESW
jgi:hypothetical protein